MYGFWDGFRVVVVMVLGRGGREWQISELLRARCEDVIRQRRKEHQFAKPTPCLSAYLRIVWRKNTGIGVRWRKKGKEAGGLERQTRVYVDVQAPACVCVLRH